MALRNPGKAVQLGLHRAPLFRRTGTITGLVASLSLFGLSACVEGNSTVLTQPVTALRCPANDTARILRVVRNPSDDSYYVVERIFIGETPTRRATLTDPHAYQATKAGDVVIYSRKREENYRGMTKYVSETWSEVNIKTGRLKLVTVEDGVNKNPSSTGLQCNYTPDEMRTQTLTR